MFITFRTVICIVLVYFFQASAIAAAGDSEKAQAQVLQMFNDYLAVYNARFGNSAADMAFKENIVGYLHTPLVMFPPAGEPRVVTTQEQAANNFAAFTSMLEKRGVEKLQWHTLEVEILSPTKAIANNTGRGVDAKGKVVYETVSVYLVFKGKDGWKIQTLSPYLVENTLHFDSVAPD
ncbi:MAG: hypothetical protein AAF194_04135 [Pseudomonadota bacterium]